MTHRVKTQICSQNLTIISDESEEYIKTLSSELDGKIRQTVRENSFEPLISNIIFCALQYCDENIKLTAENKKLKEQIEILTAENDSLKSELSSQPDKAAPKPVKQQSFFDRDQHKSTRNRGNSESVGNGKGNNANNTGNSDNRKSIER